jgi:hypothetical protein
MIGGVEKDAKKGKESFLIIFTTRDVGKYDGHHA